MSNTPDAPTPENSTVGLPTSTPQTSQDTPTVTGATSPTVTNTGNNTEQTTVDSLRAENERLRAELDRQGITAAQPIEGTTETSPEETASNADIVGVGADPRGGYVLGHSDGKVTLVDVPEQTNQGDPPRNRPAEPWGEAPEGSYSHFFVEENRYVFVGNDGKLQFVHSPVQSLS